MQTTHPHSLQFDDFDLLCESMGGWDLDLKQLDRGSFSGQVTQHAGNGLFLTRARFDRVLQQKGSPLPGVFTIGMPLEGCRPFRWHGVDVTPGDLVLLPSGWELDALSFGKFDLATASISGERMQELGAERGICTDQLFEGGSVIRRSLETTASLLDFVDRATNQLEGNDPAIRSAAARRIEQRLPSLLLDHLAPESTRERIGGDGGRRSALSLALSFVHRHAHEAPRVTQIAAASGVSVRTLRRMFEQQVGVSPKAYLQAHRMNNVYRTLRRREMRDMSITEVPGRHGFWHMGKFAAEYRRQFGVLPSDTVRRASEAQAATTANQA